MPFGVLFHSRCAKWCASSCHKIIIIGLGKIEDSGIGVPKSRTATTCGNSLIPVLEQFLSKRRFSFLGTSRHVEGHNDLVLDASLTHIVSSCPSLPQLVPLGSNKL